MDLKPRHASALQKQLTPQMWEQARQGQEATILRPSSEIIGLDSSSVTHPVALTATPPKDSYHHQTDTAQTDVSSCHFQAPSSPNRLAYGVCWRSCAGALLPPLGGGNVGRLMHWYAVCSMSVMLQSWGLTNDLAGESLAVRRWRRRPVDALAHRMLHEGDVSIMVSGSPDFGGKGRPKRGAKISSLEQATDQLLWQP